MTYTTPLGVCTVSGSSATTITVGTCTVTASQAGNDRYAPARDVQRSFAVHIGHGHGNTSQDKKASQAITFGQLAPAAVGQVVHLSASATSGLAVSFRPDTPAVCSVSGATVTTTTAGTCTVTASQAGDNRYLAAHEITQSFQVHAGHQAQTITFPQPPKAKVGEPVTLSASATSGLVVAFQSDTPRICTVSGSTLTPATAGTCAVTASQGGSDHYAAAPDVRHSFDVASAASTFPGAPDHPARRRGVRGCGRDHARAADSAALAPPAGASATEPSRCSGSRSAASGQRQEHRSRSDTHGAHRFQPRSQHHNDQGGQAMTPPPQDPPQTVLDLLFTPGEDGPTAVVPELLSPGATGDLGRALENVPATLRQAAVRETINAAKGLLDVDLTGFLVSGWQKHREVIAAARRTVAAPGSIELVNLATHQITATQRPVVNLVVDNQRVATVELGVSVVFDISALVAGIRGGRLVAVHAGRCDVTATLAIQDTRVTSRQVHLELPGIIPLGRGIRLLPDHGHSRPGRRDVAGVSGLKTVG